MITLTLNTKDMKNIFIGDKKVTRDSILDKDRANRKMVSLRGEGFDEIIGILVTLMQILM